MSWNYRVMCRTYESGKEYGIHEVYYDEDGKVASWTENPVSITTFVEECSDTVENLTDVHVKMGLALTKPVLCYETGETLI